LRYGVGRYGFYTIFFDGILLGVAPAFVGCAYLDRVSNIKGYCKQADAKWRISATSNDYLQKQRPGVASWKIKKAGKALSNSGYLVKFT
jgi:non-ribosomal peptide synthetase component E (peptide arylation enzyme)